MGAQFQLVVKGKATYPNFSVEGIGVHYTDHNTPYGPFETTEDYEMFVLHAKPAGQLFMDTLENRAKANPDGRELAKSAAEVDWEDFGIQRLRKKVLFDEPSGLKAEIIQVPAGEHVPFGPAPFGRYEIVAEGTAIVAGTTLTPYNLRYTVGEDAAAPIVAGPNGLALVMLLYDEDASKSYGGSITERLLQIEDESNGGR